MGSSKSCGGFFIYYAVFATSLTAFATGCCFAWPTPLLPKFQSSDENINPIGTPATLSESAWIVSAMPLGLIFGPIVSIVSLQFFTKKTVLLISMKPIVVAHLIDCVAHHPNIFIFARFLMGIGVGVVWAVVGNFIAEISEDRNRGLLGSVAGIMSNLGSLSVYIIGPYLDIKLFSIILLIPVILCFIGFGIFVPDSPYDLLMQKRRDKAENSLKLLRRRTNVEKELSVIIDTIQSGGNDYVHLSNVLKDRGLRKGLLICVALMTFQQLSGILAVISYAEIIFQSAGDFIPSAISTIILGVVGTIGNVASLALVDKMGRKMLLTSSCVLEAITLSTLGVYFYMLNSKIDVSVISWLPMVSLIVFIAAFNLALGIIPWIITGEVFHSSVKPLASTIVALFNFISSFVVTMCFPYMVKYLGMAWTFWTFAICMIISSIFCMSVLPETKGRSFQEIQKLLKEK